MSTICRLIARASLAHTIIPLLLLAASGPADAINLWNGAFMPVGNSNASVIVGDVLLAGQGASIEFWDISDPSAPARLSWRQTPGVVSEIVVRENFAFISCWNGYLLSIDISDPAVPLIRADPWFSSYFGKLAIVGNWLVGVDYNRSRLFRIDASNPYDLSADGYVWNTIGSGIVAIDGTTAWVGGSGGLRMFDVENLTIASPSIFVTGPSAFPLGDDYLFLGSTVFETAGMTQVATVPVNTGVKTTWVDGTTGWILETDFLLQRVDLADPTSPVVTGTVQLPLTNGPEVDLHAVGDLVTVSSNTRTAVVRRTAARGLDTFETYVVVQGGYVKDAGPIGAAIAFASGEAGMIVSDPATGWHRLGPGPGGAARGGLIQALECVAIGAFWEAFYRATSGGRSLGLPVDAPTQDERPIYAARGPLGVEMFEYSARVGLESLGMVDLGGPISGVADHGDLLFAVETGQGVHVLDISTPSNPAPLTMKSIPGATTCFAKGDYLYVAGSIQGVILDLADPADPQQVATFPAALSIAIGRGRLYVGENFQLTIWDVSDPTSPSLLATDPTYMFTRDITPVRGPGGTHVVWLALGNLGIAAVDFTDPVAPVVLETWQSMDIAEGVIPLRDKVYVADGAAGIHVLRDRDAELDPAASPGDVPELAGASIAGSLRGASGAGGRAAEPDGPGHSGASSADPTADLRLGNSPNPVRSHTDVQFRLARSERVSLEVFDITGRRVATLLDRSLPAGQHSARWDGRDAGGSRVAAGVYLYRFATANARETGKMLVVR